MGKKGQLSLEKKLVDANGLSDDDEITNLNKEFDGNKSQFL